MGVDDRGPFALRLRGLREGASLSQEELAARAGLTAKAVGALERGERRRPYPNTVRALAEALGLDDDGREALAAAARGEHAAGGGPALGEATEGVIPVPPTTTIGREEERRAVAALLQHGPARLVTLTGPGGVGKSRLAWSVAADLRREGDSVVPVELAPLGDAELVVPTIARALGVRAASEDVLEVVAAVIGDRRRVLVLDNLEHVLGAAPALADLLGRCAELRVLATSRAPLRIRAEQEHPVLPLAVPDDDGVDVVLASPAGRLFVDRARAAAPQLELDRATASAVATLCRRLDGLPLAIELVAAHARYVAPTALVDRLDRALDAATVRDLPERQQTMTATLEWSLALCTDDERRLLEVLSVFAGGFDAEGVVAVARGTVADPSAALDGLVEQSLVSLGADPGGRRRHRLLEPVRNVAAARLAPDEADELRRRHAEHLASVAAGARRGLRGPDQAGWLRALAAQHADLAASLRFLIDRGDLSSAATIGADVWLYWALRGHAAEGLGWTGRVLGASPVEPLTDDARVAALVASAGLRLATGDTGTSLRHAAEAVDLARSLGDPQRHAEALVLLSTAALFEGAMDQATGAIEELEPLADRNDDRWARAHERTARAQLAIVRDELDDARRVLREAEALAREQAGPFTLATALNVGATLAQLDGDDELVLDRLAEAAAIAAEVGTTWTLVYTLPALAGLAVRRGDAELAATLFAAGAATTERSMVAVTFGPDAEAAAAQLELVRQRLDSDLFERAWARGRELGPDDILELLDRFTGRGEPT